MNPPARPAPELPGLAVVELLGTGPEADVFLYRQPPPGRPVAVKVGHAGPVSPEHRRLLTDGAGAVAALSAHPHIVRVHTAGVAPDGRPYLVMDHYPGPHLAERGRRGELAVAEVLRVGVQLAAALETAHRAGIVHGDVRPANVLVSVDHRVGLTDFAPVMLAFGRNGGAVEGSRVPFTAPEVLGGRSDGSVAADVYGLCATLYLLLAGRPPAWVPGGDNSSRALTVRIRAGEVPRLTGVDVPSALRDLVAAGLGVDPRRRPGSALALAEGLQTIERERNLRPTPLAIGDPAGADPTQAAGAGGAAMSAAASGPTADPGPGPTDPAPSTTIPAAVPAGEPRPTPPPPAGADGPADTGRRRVPIAVAALVASLLVLGAGYAAVSRPDPSEVAVADTSDGEEAASTTTRVTTTITAPVETVGTETAPPPEPAPDPTDPTTPTTAVVLPSSPAPGAARPTISPPRPTTTPRPAQAPPTPVPPTTARPPDPSVCVAGGGCPGRAYWTSNDDLLHVCDATSDGYVVVAEYRRSDAAGTGRLESQGGNTCNQIRLDLRSGGTVTFRACLENRSGDPSRCSAWVTGQS